MNRFDVQIRAIDNFTKTFRNLNNQASKAARPLVNVQRQIGSLAREIHLDKAAKGVGMLSDATVTLTRTLGLSLGPLESVLGAGGIVGGLFAAGGAAIGLGVNFARTGFEVSRTSHAIGMSTRDMQRWRGAAELASVETEAMDSTLRSLGTTLEDAKFGRNGDALNALRTLGIDIPERNGVVDQNAALEQIAQALSRISDPQLRNVLAKALNIDPRVIPLLEQGADGVHRLQDEAEKYGYVLSTNAIQQTERFTASLSRLKVQAEGLGKSLGLRALPVLQAGVDATSDRLFQSRSNPVRALMGFEGDSARGLMRITGVGALFNKARDLIRGPDLTAPEQRTVHGKIGGPAWPTTASRGANELSAAENAALDDFTPAERRRQQESEDSAENRRELIRELQKTRDPTARNILQGELTKLDQRVHVEVTIKGAPPGTSASARVGSAGNASVSARVQYAMPSLDMP